MKKIFKLLLLLMILPITVKAYEIEVLNPGMMGGSSEDSLRAVVPTKDGGMVSVGYVNSTNMENFKNNGAAEAIIIKQKADGTIEWMKNWGTYGGESFMDVKETADGGFIAVGHSTVLYNPDGPSYEGDAIIVKYDKNGNVEWENHTGGLYCDEFFKVDITSDGGYIAVGETEAILSHNGRNPLDGFAVKFDKNGNVVWTEQLGGEYEDNFEAVTATSDGGFIISGFTRSEKFGNIDVNGYAQTILLKYDKDCKLEWYKEYGGTGTDVLNSIVVTDKGEIIAGGYTSSQVGTMHGASGYDGIIVKFDENLNDKLLINYGGDSSDFFYDIIETRDENYVAVGYIMSFTVNNLVNKGEYDCIAIKVNKDGKLLWEQNYGGNSYDMYESVTELNDGRLAMVGMSQSTDIEGLTNHGSYDLLMVSYKFNYEIVLGDIENGEAKVEKDENKATIVTTPEEGFIVDEVIVKDSDGNEIPVTKENDNEFTVDVYDDITVDVIFKKVYKITLTPVKNGKATAEQYEEYKGRVNAVPNEGYELDTIVIKDTTGKEVVYEEKDGYYFFDVNDDLEITVTFKELPKEVVKGDEEETEEKEENPKTADAFIYYACATVCSLFGIWSVEQYKKTRES